MFTELQDSSLFLEESHLTLRINLLFSVIKFASTSRIFIHQPNPLTSALIKYSAAELISLVKFTCDQMICPTIRVKFTHRDILRGRANGLKTFTRKKKRFVVFTYRPIKNLVLLQTTNFASLVKRPFAQLYITFDPQLSARLSYIRKLLHLA